MNQHLQNILSIVLQDESLTGEQKDTIAKSLKDADKELEITSFKLEKTEKVKRTTAILLEETIEELEQKRKAVEAQNRELEIESSLERVRAQAMSMRQSEELLGFCEILLAELKTLGFTHIRNTQIVITTESKDFFINYQFSDYGVIGIKEIHYKGYYLLEEFVNNIKRGNDYFVMKELSGNELEKWKEDRIKNGDLDDPKLNEASSLYYYWYSTATGAVGISAFKPITDEQLKILQRFRNVFELTYRRFMDIEKAGAQAREAKIEAALERARTQSMIMQHSSELSDTLQVFHQQLQLFGINSDFSYLWLPDEEKDKHLFWAVWEEEKNGATFFKNNALTYPLDRDEPYTAVCLADWKSGVAIHAYKVAPAGVKDYFAAWGELFSSAEKLKAEFFPDGFSYVEAYMKYGCFGIAISRVLTDEEKQLLRRFTIEFERAYTRFLDLKKAEAQAREAQIEAALERVRSRTMAMQRSAELQEAAFLLFQQVQALGARYFACGFNIWDDDRREATAWMAREQGFQPPFKTSSSEDVFFHIHEAAQRGETLFVAEQGGQVLETHYKYMASIPIFKSITDKMAEAGLSVPSFQIIHCAFFSQGYLMFISFEPVPDAHDIFKRFAKVFEQTYTRFLDLQKAEAQAREAQIELGLERVRARAMAMQKSDELAEAAQLLYHEFGTLGLDPFTCGYLFIKEEQNKQTAWVTLPDGTLIPDYIDFPLTGDPILDNRYRSWKKKEALHRIELKGEENKAHHRFLASTVPAPVANEIFAQIPENIFVYCANFSAGYLFIIATKLFTSEAEQTITRFSRVFEMTYTRFLDLKQAEEQARESQIELGLERVRARAMAMQKSGELSELVDTVFKELTKLDFALTWCIINIIDESSLSNTVWAANPDITKAPESYHMLFEDYPFHHAMMKGWKERNTKSVYTLEGEEKRIYDDYLFSETEFKRTPEAAQAASRAMEKYVVSFSFSNFGGLQTVGDVPLSDANLEILSRFGKVFDLTYTRFNDLKQAEAQARESQIQLALERVRARTMAMQHSDDLQEAARVLFEQMEGIGVQTGSCGFNIWDKKQKTATVWMSSAEGGLQAPFILPHTESEIYKQVYEAMKKGEDFLVKEVGGKTLEKHFDYLLTLPGIGDVIRKLRATGYLFPERIVYHFAFFAQGYLSFHLHEHHTETHEIFKRFAKVFEQTYTRFLDLQKAEAQARESQIEATLEKVRSHTMGMRSSEDLAIVAAVMFDQMKILGGDLFSFGIVLCDKHENMVEQWHGIPHTGMLAPFFVPVNMDHIHQFRYDQWKAGVELFSIVIPEDYITHHFELMLELPSVKAVWEGIAAKGISLPPIPTWEIDYGASFKYGYLLVSALKPFEEDKIFPRFAKVFEQAYTRFLDLQKAEAQAREAKIEAALEKVRSRSLAMHKSEELQEVVTAIFERLQDLDIQTDAINLDVFNENKKDAHLWTAVPGHQYSEEIHIPYNETAIFKDIYDGMISGKEIHSKVYSRELKDEFLNYVFEHTDFRYMPEERKEMLFATDGSTVSVAYAKNTAIIAQRYRNDAFSDDDNEILKRFARVFEQAYTRFLDLQKAEAQARESQIQLALERVRARTMAMQRSDELQDAASLMVQQIQTLGVPQFGSGFNIWDDDRKAATAWMCNVTTDNLPPPFKTSSAEDIFLDIHDAAQRGETLFVREQAGKELETHYKCMNSIPVFREYVESVSSEGLSIPDFQIMHCAFFSHGYLMFITYKPVPEAYDIFIRFAKVFEQTYTRFLDLQKAEAQAREGQIEAALERVRSRSMGMQKSEELKEVIQVVYEQFVHLNIHVEHTGFIMDYKERSDMHIWLADKHTVPFQVTIPYFDCAHWNSFNEAKGKGIDFFANKLSFEEKNKFYQDLFKLVPGVPEETLEYYFSCPGLAISTVLLENVGLYIENFSGIPYSDDENATLMRFGKVFQQTYTRFLDLQKAEVQAREAQIELALERVRARTMAMQKSDELREAVLVIYQQLQELDFGSQACNIIIIDKDTGDEQFWVSGFTQQIFPESYHVPHLNHHYQEDQFTAWRNGVKYAVFEYAGTEKKKFDKIFFTQTDFRKLPEQAKQFMIGLESVKLSTAFTTYGSLQVLGPEPLSEEKATILKRFAKVFEQTYTRFLDLKKAEAQGREAQIEAALEKIRSRSLAMHTANELGEVVTVIVEKLKDLGVVLDANGVILCTYFQHSKDVMHWIVSPDYSMAGSYLLPYFDHPIFNAAWQSKENGDEYFSRAFPVVEKNSFFEYAFEHSDYRYFPDDLKQWIFQNDQHILSFAWQKNSAILIPSHTGVLPSEEDIAILKRFAKVFEQSYVRFLDLQKAEAQAKESQIQLALERVRARTMAMQHSDELKDAAAILFQQAKALGVPAYSCGYNIWEKDENEFTSWMSTQDGSDFNAVLNIPLTEDANFIRYVKSKQNGEQFFVLELQGERMQEHYEYLKTIPAFKAYFDYAISVGFDLPETQIHHVANFSHGNLLFITLGPCPEFHDVFKRFAAIFEQTYTRFLDLQKAETQAREAQVETALEKVRSRSLAMHKSDELQEVVHTVFEKLKELDVELYTAIIIIFTEGSKDMVWWLENKASQQYARVVIPFRDNHYLKDIFDAKEKGKDFFSATYSREEKNELFNHLFENTEFKYVPEPQKRFLLESDMATMSVALAKYTAINITSYTKSAFSAKENEILKRFAKVFDQAYTRFLDLQRAEVQAREATIEAALEKVRGKAIAMHNSNDLSITASMVFTELRKLGINPVRCGVSLQTKESRKNLLYYSIPSAKGDTLSLAGSALLSGHPVLSEIYDSWLRSEDYFPVLKGESLINYYQTLRQVGFDVPVSPSSHEQYGYYISFSEGMFYGWVEKSLTESEIKILKRFASVIDLTFRRYIELQKSEANAKEAVKQAALDRIRADIASMRTINDLDRITPLIWNELTILGVTFIRCGVFIMDDSQQLIHTFLSSPDGKAIAAFHLPYDTPGNLSKVLSHWNNHENYIDHWEESAFTELADTLVKQGAIATPGQYLDTIPHGGFYLHFLPFLQGMLYVGNTTQLSDEDTHLIQSVADAFSTAYARYEDFNKLEAAKQTVDKTLVDLKQAQTQLVQSEKMASLGELTAGIAHEIQNPLNFVNNFSEVSNELLDEMIAELGSGAKEDAIAIANDVKQNLEKILHHGKRADGIVKGMLQHSRSSTAVKEPTDINKLADEYLRLAYHGLRAKDKSFNATLKTDFDESIGSISIIPQDIGRAVLNLITNAFYVVGEKNKQTGNGYEPTVSVSTKKIEDKVEIRVADNGNGIPPKVLDKVFQPFFTTKPTGQGTGLGLSLSYDVVKAHGGELKVTTTEGEGSEFIIQLPVV